MVKVKEGIYKHYKGNNYLVLGNAHHSETLEEVVVYRALYKHEKYGENSLWVRPAKMFGEKINKEGKLIERFSFQNQSRPLPRVGVWVIVVKQGKILLGRRKGAHGEGTWSVPGGNMEYGESIEACAIREVKEETGITISNPRICSVTNDIFRKEKKHYLTIWVKADYESGTITISEPDKFLNINWLSPTHLPSPLFLPLKNFIRKNALIE